MHLLCREAAGQGSCVAAGAVAPAVSDSERMCVTRTHSRGGRATRKATTETVVPPPVGAGPKFASGRSPQAHTNTPTHPPLQPITRPLRQTCTHPHMCTHAAMCHSHILSRRSLALGDMLAAAGLCCADLISYDPLLELFALILQCDLRALVTYAVSGTPPAMHGTCTAWLTPTPPIRRATVYLTYNTAPASALEIRHHDGAPEEPGVSISVEYDVPQFAAVCS